MICDLKDFHPAACAIHRLNAFLLKSADHLEQILYLFLGDGRCRLIHNDRFASYKRARESDQLVIRNCQVFNILIKVYFKINAGMQCFVSYLIKSLFADKLFSASIFPL